MTHYPTVKRLTITVVLVVLALILPWSRTAVGQQPSEITLAYVMNDTVTLADVDGKPLIQTGPTFTYGQGARLFWSADGRTLYIARDDGLYLTGAAGGAAALIPGYYGRTLTIAQDAQSVYYLETVSPQPLNQPEGRVSFPFRELESAMLDGSAGRLAGYFGQFQAGAAQANLTFASALYVRDGGLLGPGRPNLWPSYGSNVFGTCCFPDPGLGIFNVQTGDFSVWDETFIPGAAALNLTRTHLAGPTTDGLIRVIDLITGGERDYGIEIAGGLGTIERIAWSPDDSYLYLAARHDASHPLSLDTDSPFPVDPSSADIHIYRLNLVTSVIRELAWRSDEYAVSSLAFTEYYVFAVVVDRNAGLVQALNARQIRPGSQPNDPALAG
ncbi:MAG: PD40 domain-containing protein, partial [Chloroflexi bacterium]|nr:PD40 domain-containing protein [Chloroflexota bacterium]